VAEQGETSVVAAPEAPVAKGFPLILPSLGWILLYFVLQILATGITIVIATLTGKRSAVGAGKLTSDALMAQAIVPILWALVLSTALLLGLLWLYLRKDNRAARIGLTHFGHLSRSRTLVLGGLLVAGAMLFNNFYATYIIPGVEMQDQITKMLNSIPPTPVNLTLRFVAIAVAAPVVEELLFRGLLQNAFARRMRPMFAIWLAALVFAVVHAEPYATPALMVLGAAFGYLYHKTGSLRTNIALHMINNAAALFLLQG
jgi:uncharacterized protein